MLARDHNQKFSVVAVTSEMRAGQGDHPVPTRGSSCYSLTRGPSSPPPLRAPHPAFLAAHRGVACCAAPLAAGCILAPSVNGPRSIDTLRIARGECTPCSLRVHRDIQRQNATTLPILHIIVRGKAYGLLHVLDNSYLSRPGASCPCTYYAAVSTVT